MTRSVLSVGYPFAALEPDPVGGAEQVLAHMDRAIVEAGWRSLVVAPEGSSTVGELTPGPPVPPLIEAATRERVHAGVRRAIAQVLARERVDLVHLHGVDFPDYLPAPGPPVLATLHLPLSWYPPQALNPARPLTWLNPVSAAQARDAGRASALTRPIENGVDVQSFARAYARRSYVAALGRMCPEKGFHLALDAAIAADTPLLLAGDVFPYPEHQRYFETEIRPRLDARRRWIGPVRGRAKRRLLGSARAVLIPSLVPETSSLVAREALAAGTPVVAFATGALVEVIDPGRTGFLVSDVAAMTEAIRLCDGLDPGLCRRAAHERFGLSRMTDAYLELYRELIAIAEEAHGGRRATG